MGCMTTQPKVLIIGAGISGLALAQGLKSAQIPFQIFERDPSTDSRPQGYRIRISTEGAASLKELLPSDLWNSFEEKSALVLPGGLRVNALTGEPADWPGQGPPKSDERAYNADRAVMRNILMSGLEDSISFGKRFDHYVVGESSGEVEVHFEDGTITKGTVLVGADGIRSGVRRILLPEIQVLDTQGRAVFGKTTATSKLMSQVPESIDRGINLAGDGLMGPVKLFSDIMRFKRDQVSEQEQHLRFQVPPDYIYWVLLFLKEVEDAIKSSAESDLLSLTDTESSQLACKLTSGWHHTVRTILEQQEQDAASTLKFFMSTGENLGSAWAKLRTKNVAAKPPTITLIGDAAHPMPPIGGKGANVALEDAEDLFKALANTDESNTQVYERVVAYEQAMIRRAKEHADRLGGPGAAMFGMKPLNEMVPAKI